MGTSAKGSGMVAGRPQGGTNPYGGGQQPRMVPVSANRGMINSFGEFGARLNYDKMQNDIRQGRMAAPGAPGAQMAAPAAPVAPKPPPEMGTITAAQMPKTGGKPSAPVSYFKNAADIAPGAIGNIRPNAGAIGVNRVRGVAPPPPPAPVQQPQTIYYPWRPSSYFGNSYGGGDSAGGRQGSAGYGYGGRR